MTGEEVSVTLISSLISGKSGVLISYVLFVRYEKRRVKHDVARKLFANKYDTTNPQFSEAMNEILIVFADDKRVISELKALWDAIETEPSKRTTNPNDKLLSLVREVCRSVNAKHDLPDEYYLRYFKGQ